MVSEKKTGFSRILLWDIDSERLLLELPDKPSLGLKTVTFNTAGNLLAAGGHNGIFLWDLKSKQALNEKRLHEGKPVLSLAFCQQGNFNLIACGSDDGTIILFDLDSLKQVGTPLKGHDSEVNEIVYSPDLGLLASSGSHKILLWDLNFERRACQIANRNFSDKEWSKFIGTDFVYQHPCGKFLANKP
jgi:WD40 repeat protein